MWNFWCNEKIGKADKSIVYLHCLDMDKVQSVNFYTSMLKQQFTTFDIQVWIRTSEILLK